MIGPTLFEKNSNTIYENGSHNNCKTDVDFAPITISLIVLQRKRERRVWWSERRTGDALHDDVIKGKHFPCYWPFVRGIHRSPVNSPHKSQWRRALMFSLMYAWINGWANNREAGYSKRHHAHYDVTVMVHQPVDQIGPIWSSIEVLKPFFMLWGQTLQLALLQSLFSYWKCRPHATAIMTSTSLQWRHNGCHGVSNHQPHDCLLNRWFRRRSKKTSKLRDTGLCAGNSPVTGEFPHKWPVTRKMFPFDDVIIYWATLSRSNHLTNQV